MEERLEERGEDVPFFEQRAELYQWRGFLKAGFAERHGEAIERRRKPKRPEPSDA